MLPPVTFFRAHAAGANGANCHELLVQKLSLTKILSGTNAITSPSYINTTLSSKAKLSPHTHCPLPKDHLPPSPFDLNIHTTQSIFPSQAQDRLSQTSQAFSQTLLSSFPCPHLSGYSLATSGPLCTPGHTSLLPSCSCRHPTSSSTPGLSDSRST